MREDERNLTRELDYFQEESEKERQLRKLLHGHDRHWHQTDWDDFATLSAADELEDSTADAAELNGGARSEKVKSICLDGGAQLEVDELELDRRRWQPSADLKNDLAHKFVRFILEFCSLVCNLDLFGGRIRGHRCIQISLFDNFIRLRLFSYAIMEQSAWLRSLRFRSLLQRLVFLLYATCATHLLYYLYHQYSYDYHRFRLMRVRWLNATHSEEAHARKLTLEREDELLEAIQRRETQIQRIGGPQMHLSFAVECVYLMFLFTSFLAYIITQLFFKFLAPFDFYFVRNFIDYPTEQRRQRIFVREQVRNFIDSSRNHTRALVWFSRKSLGARLYFKRHGIKLLHIEQQQQQQQQQQRRRQPSRRLSKQSVEQLIRREIEGSPEGDQVGVAAAALGEFDAGELDELDFPESFSCKQLLAMLGRSDLRPMNQTSGWVAKQLYVYTNLWLFCILVSCAFDATVLYLIFFHTIANKRFTWSDCLISTDLVWLLFICNIVTLFYTSINVFTAIDQAQLAIKLRQLIELVINLNNLRFYRNLQRRNAPLEGDDLKEARRNTLVSLREFQREPEAQVEARRDKLLLELFAGKRQRGAHSEASFENAMNKDILLALMHYKIFVAAIKPLKRSLQMASFIVVCLMFLFPIITRLHTPYCMAEQMEEARVLTVTLSLLIIVPVDINLIPICYLHKRCMNLYDQLNRLLAHATDIINYPEGRGIYDRHIVSILRKELCFPERVDEQFAIKLTGFSFTYSGLVRLHFYFGFIILSIISENQASQQEVVGTLLQDPFGLF